ncbi:unnamed protein product, partial [Laminaria digitata]
QFLHPRINRLFSLFFSVVSQTKPGSRFKSTTIRSCPDELLMQLSRFDVKFRNNVYTREKLTYLVDFPAVLDATPFTTAGKQSGAPPVVYDLQGVVHHSGTAHAGHYVAFVRGADGAWCLHNDAKVTS